MPNIESLVERPAHSLWHETDFNSALMVLSEQDLVDSSAFPLGARTASRRLSRGHREADMLTTSATPSAKDCHVVNDSASAPARTLRSTRATQPSMPCSSMHQLGRTAGAKAVASTKLRIPAAQPGIVVQWSGLNLGERLHLSSSRQEAAVSNEECLRCAGGMRVWILSEARCCHCDKALSRAPAAHCTLCLFTLCIACRIQI